MFERHEIELLRRGINIFFFFISKYSFKVIFNGIGLDVCKMFFNLIVKIESSANVSIY